MPETAANPELFVHFTELIHTHLLVIENLVNFIHTEQVLLDGCRQQTFVDVSLPPSAQMR